MGQRKKLKSGEDSQIHRFLTKLPFCQKPPVFSILLNDILYLNIFKDKMNDIVYNR